MGALLIEELMALQEKYPIIGDVRGGQRDRLRMGRAHEHVRYARRAGGDGQGRDR